MIACVQSFKPERFKKLILDTVKDIAGLVDVVEYGLSQQTFRLNVIIEIINGIN